MSQSKCKKILEAIDQKTLNKKIVTRCKYADASFKPKNSLPKNFSEFQEDCSGFWKHLHEAFYGASINNHFEDTLGHSRMYLEKVFHNSGGMKYALHKAQTETFNSVKFYITNIFIDEAVERYIDSILKTYVDPFNYKEIEELMKEYIERFDIQLEKYGDFQMMVANYEVILKSHAKRHSQLELDREMGAIVGD